MLLAAAGAGVAGPLVHVEVEMKAQLELERLESYANPIVERHYTQKRGGAV